ncbi:hypothetical protein N7456_003696 [Penicillium angulare]|uniref:Uncharacterized protein n=1 Tax=Penicillium angulare TaxID=116970 RepID=A0A9W9FV37_9EURO|nr:hypothetical protein N7456_003696 [Penicillium angulare]
MGNIELDDIERYRPPAYWRVKGQNPPTHFFKPPHRICKCNDHHPPERFPTNNAILAIPPCVTACPYCGFESFADDSLSGVIVRDHILRRHISRDPVFSNIEVQPGVILPSPEPSTQPSSTHV